RLSFRDILKYSVLSQDDVGSKQLLDSNNFAVAVKNQETFKFLHNLLDTNISELNALISDKSNTKKALENNYKTISAFFRETNLKTTEDLNKEKDSIKENIDILTSQLGMLDEKMKADTHGFEHIRRIKWDIEKKIKSE